MKLQKIRYQTHEVIVVDGGSTDATVKLAHPLCDCLLFSQPSRARQMNAGAAQAAGNLLLFLHADTYLPENALALLSEFSDSDKGWGHFDVRLTGCRPMLRVIEQMISWRSRVTGIATGDQAIFVRRDLFNTIDGFPDQPLMEDIEISRRLKAKEAPYCIHSPVLTSSRRWEEKGIWRTVYLMWKLRLQYFYGTSPDLLYKQYYR